MAYYFATFVVILITHETIFPVKGQCTVQGCDNGDPLSSLVAEIQQLRVDLFDQLNKQVQSIHELLDASFQEMNSQHNNVNMSFQAVDRCPKEYDIYSKHFQRMHDILNESFKETKSHREFVETSLQAVDRRSQEQDIYIRQVQSILELLNESFQEIKTQHGTVLTSLQVANRTRLLDHEIYIKQGQSIHELLNESFQEMKNQRSNVNMSLQAVDQRLLEQNICIKQGRSIHELLNESFQDMKSQHGTIMKGLQAVDRGFQEHDISIKNQTHNSWDLANGSCSPASDVCDCSDIKASGQTTSGVYEVCVVHQLNRTCTYAYCEMDTNNGTSLVFQRRKDGSVNFNRTWADYKQGFGHRNGEFWLGNEMLHQLTSKRNYKLRIELEDFHGNKSFAEYTRFLISSSHFNYTLLVGEYSGTAGDSLSYNSKGIPFSTDDVDNDNCGATNCARTNGGAWWHGCCSSTTLNGKYYHIYDSVSIRKGIHWYYWHQSWSNSLKATEMKLVPVA